MTVVGIPTTSPIPWPNPHPGVGTPLPGSGTITNPGNVTTNPVVSPGTGTGGITGPFADLFKFTPNWKFWGALILVAASVELVDQTYPEYVWIYVGILFLALMLTLAGFTPQLTKWLGP